MQQREPCGAAFDIAAAPLERIRVGRNAVCERAEHDLSELPHAALVRLPALGHTGAPRWFKIQWVGPRASLSARDLCSAPSPQTRPAQAAIPFVLRENDLVDGPHPIRT